MEQRCLGLKVISAKGLNNVKHLRSMHLYVSVSMLGGVSETITFNSPVDFEGVSNPVWNFAMKFKVNEKELQSNTLELVFRIRCFRALRGDKDVGDVHVPVKDLLDKSNDSSTTTTTVQVNSPFSGPGAVGELTFSYAFDQAPAARQPILAQPFIVPTGSIFMAGTFTQTTETCVERPPGYPPLGQPMMMPYPPAPSPVLPYPPPNPTVAPPIAIDPTMLSGIPGVDVDREKTEYELQLESALAGLLQAIGALDVEENSS